MCKKLLQLSHPRLVASEQGSTLSRAPDRFRLRRDTIGGGFVTPITAKCFCGALRYKITGGLPDARSCHCSRCRKAFSSQASADALVDPGGFHWVAGEELLTTYTGVHGFGFRFCSICGSTLCGAYRGQVHGVTLGCVDGDPGVEISRHIFTGSKAPWEVLPAGIVAFDEGPDAAG